MKKMVQESGLSRVYDHIQEHDAGTITAYRGSNTRKINQAKNKHLMSKLKSAGYGITAVKGAFIEGYGTPEANEVSEESFFVVDLKDSGTLRKTLIKLGEEFEQDSIIFIPKGGEGVELIGTSKTKGLDPSYGQSIKIGNTVMGKTGEMGFSRVGGRAFVFEHVLYEVPEPANIHSKAANHRISLMTFEEYLRASDNS